MQELATRMLGDGSRTAITLFQTDGGFVVEAENVNGKSTGRTITGAEAHDWYMHPFCNVERLDYPRPQARGEGIGHAPEALLAHHEDLDALAS